ncbi:heme o synthase [Hahella sp. SMD15-11]|uniref:Protoheme IX farnesyltransferase n=1 Tax=Thermohahella caldifontis TaxID=3142973 RepID=A0AB39UU45_9GAMM
MKQAVRTAERPLWRDYLELTKPRVVALLILTAVVGMLLAPHDGIPWTALIAGNLGIALLAGAAAVINHVVDARVDAVMARTHRRPVAQGRVDPQYALLFAALLGVAGTVILALKVNLLTTWLTLASLIGYAVIYTVFLKRATPQNIVLGGLAGAAPPLLGWTAVTDSIHPHALLLVLIIFTWTPPHFWALAIHRREDYAKAGIPMLPVTHGVHYTALQVLLYTILLLIVSLLPWLTGMSGPVYAVAATLLGLRFLHWAVRMVRGQDRLAPIRTFRYSITYLMLLFVALFVDHYGVI